MFSRADEEPRSEPDVFTFEFWSPKATFAGHLAIFRFPKQAVAWYTTAVFRQDAPVVALADAFGLKRSLELRGDGLWADHNLEDPFVHWSVGLEAFALALDDPADERGERVPLGYDLDWEMDAAAIAPLDDDGGYEQPASVHGEVLLGADAYELDARGWRSHRSLAAWAPGRHRHGLSAHGSARWSGVDDVQRPGDDALGWSLAATAGGLLRKAPWRSEAHRPGEIPAFDSGFVELWEPTERRRG